MQSGLYMEPALEVSFSPIRYLTLSAYGSWRYITGPRGDTVITFNSDTSVFSNEAGAAYSAFDAGIIFKFTLPNSSRPGQRKGDKY